MIFPSYSVVKQDQPLTFSLVFIAQYHNFQHSADFFVKSHLHGDWVKHVHAFNKSLLII